MQVVFGVHAQPFVNVGSRSFISCCLSQSRLALAGCFVGPSIVNRLNIQQSILCSLSQLSTRRYILLRLMFFLWIVSARLYCQCSLKVTAYSFLFRLPAPLLQTASTSYTYCQHLLYRLPALLIQTASISYTDCQHLYRQPAPLIQTASTFYTDCQHLLYRLPAPLIQTASTSYTDCQHLYRL